MQCRRVCPCRNYLRVRGEYRISRQAPNPHGELPPRARRIHVLMVLRFFCTGTTSACAENTRTRQHPAPGRRNYLRVRGEYARASFKCSWSMELPPRARRIPERRTKIPGYAGTTSACAENTPQKLLSVSSARNYLRVRGEYVKQKCMAPGKPELPPRARRIRPQNTMEHDILGTTSACAENTAPLNRSSDHSGNYLRVRGEYQKKMSCHHG